MATMDCLLPKEEDLSRVLGDFFVREGLHATSSNREQVFEDYISAPSPIVVGNETRVQIDGLSFTIDRVEKSKLRMLQFVAIEDPKLGTCKSAWVE